MERNTQQQKPDNIIFGELKGSLAHKDTLNNCYQVLEMLEYLDLSEGLTLDAKFGYYLTLQNVIETLRYVSGELKVTN